MSDVNGPEESLTVSIQTMESSNPISIDSNNCNTNEQTEIYLELASYSSESENNNEIRGANNEKKLTSVVEDTIEYTDTPDITSTTASADNNARSSSTIQDTVNVAEQQCKFSSVNQDYDIREEPIKGEKIINNEATSIAISTYDESNDENAGIEIEQKTESNEENIGKNNELNSSNNNSDNEAKIENMMAEKEENPLVALTELNSRMDDANEGTTTKDDSINSYREQQQQQQQQQDYITTVVIEVVQGQGDNSSATNIKTNEIIRLEKDNEQIEIEHTIETSNHPETANKCNDELDRNCFMRGQADDNEQSVDGSCGQTIFHLESKPGIKIGKEEKEKDSNITQQEQETLLALGIFARNIVECEIRKYIESIIDTIDNKSAIADLPLDETADTETYLKADKETDAKKAFEGSGETETTEIPGTTVQAITQPNDEQLAVRGEQTLGLASGHSDRVEDINLVDPGHVDEINWLDGAKQDEIEQTVSNRSSDFIEREKELKGKNDDNIGERNDNICDTNEQVETVIISSTIKEDMALNSDHAISSDTPNQQLLKSHNEATDPTKLPIAGSSDDMNLADEEFDNDVDDDEKEPLFVARQVVMKRNKDPRDEYNLKEELGRGKFGTVYKCSDNTNGTLLAAKFIHLRRREDREDVEREVDIMKSLQHKRLLQLYDAFDDGHNEMCLIMELVEGGELFERVIDDDFKLTEKMAAIFMRQICEGVRYMHEQNIVHLDMKPENILCVSKRSNRIKLIDFGLARRLEPNSKLQVLFGTPDFAAPEVLSYDSVTLATDMWSVGVICYVLLSGLSPFMGDTDLETMTNVTKAAYDFEDEAFDPISDSARDFISRLLVKDQALRMNPSECLVHNWLTKTQLTSANVQRDSEGNGAFDQSLDKTKLRKYVVRRKWQKAIHAILALRRMGATF